MSSGSMEAFDFKRLATVVNQARVAHYENEGLDPHRARKQSIAALSALYSTRRAEQALSFIANVREAFADNPGAYNEFFHALKLYEANVLDLRDTIIRLMLLCSGSPALLRGLNMFLPGGFRLNVVMGDTAVELATPEGRTLYPIAHHPPRVL